MHIAAGPAVRSDPRTITLYTDMPNHSILVSPSSVKCEFVRTTSGASGVQYVYNVAVRTGQQVVISLRGVVPPATAEVAPVAWPEINGTNVSNWWCHGYLTLVRETFSSA